MASNSITVVGNLTRDPELRFTQSGKPTVTLGLAVNRRYQLYTKPEFKPAIFLQGSCEPTHGLSDTLLSILAARTSEICAALDQKTALYASSPCKQEVTAP